MVTGRSRAQSKGVVSNTETPASARRQPVLAVFLGAAGIGALALAAWGVWSVASQFSIWQQARTAYDAAVELHDAALTAHNEQVAQLEAARQRLIGLDDTAQALLGLRGTPAEVKTSPGFERGADVLTWLERAPGRDVAAVLLDSVDASELEAEALRLGQAAEMLRVDSRAWSSLTVFASTSAAALESEVAVAMSDVAVRMEALLSSRADASAESRDTLRAVLDDLVSADVAMVSSQLEQVGDLSRSVVRSSNLVRIDDPDSVVVVVNKKRPLRPQNFVPKLVHVDVPHISSPLLRKEAAKPLVRMFAAFHAETGERLRLQNSYRSFATQTNTYNYHVSTKGQAQADRGSARPGHSEHQTGLALDVNGVGFGCSIQQCFGEMVHGRWLEKNAWRFGWVVRYPKGFEHITGYDWEPWHLRFVGVDVSTEMHRDGIATLEEYFGLGPATSY